MTLWVDGGNGMEMRKSIHRVLPDGSKDHGFGVGGEYSQASGSFRGTLVEKLLTYGLGRGAEIEDGPQVRKIVRESAEHDYRFIL